MKYSILIPVRGGMPYLEFATQSVLRSDYQGFELLVSVDPSDTDSGIFLESLDDPRLRIFRPPSEMSMAEHWDWLQSCAEGDWQLFLGQDDGLQDYFFDLADLLTAQAERLGLRAIASSRAYIHWPGSPTDPDPRGKVERVLREKITVRSMTPDVIRAIIGNKSYFDLPHMYTSSLVQRGLLSEARSRQGGKLVTSHPQDASLAAVVASLEDDFLKSWVPLGWVGTSVRSAGVAISQTTGGNLEGEQSDHVREQYLESINQSKIRYPSWAGSFELGNTRVYLWQALLATGMIPQSIGVGRLLRKPLFLELLLARCMADFSGESIELRQIARKNLGLIAKRNGLGKPTNVFFYSLARCVHGTQILAKKIKKLVKTVGIRPRAAAGFSIIQTPAGDPRNHPFCSGTVWPEFLGWSVSTIRGKRVGD